MPLTQKLSEHTKVLTFSIVADHSSTTDVGWVDARNFRKFAVKTNAVALTGVGLTTFVLEGNTASNGAGTNVVLATHAIGTAPDAVNDGLYLEADLDDAAAATSIRYVNARVVAANAADDHAFVYILSEAKHAEAGLSGDTIP